MNIGELKAVITPLPDALEIVVRCEWEGETPNGTCFELQSVSVADDHTTGEDFAAFDCDQGDVDFEGISA